MLNKSLVIFGSKGFAEMAHYLFSTDSQYTVVAFCVDSAYLTDTQLMGIPVVPLHELKEKYPPENHDVFVAVGLQRLNSARTQKCEELRQIGYKLASFISSTAIAPKNLILCDNTMIMENVVIHPFVEIGQNCIIWSCSKIALKTKIEDNCWITSATIGESCNLGQNTFVGLDATIAPFCSVGAYSLLGAKCLVAKNVGNHSVVHSGSKKLSKVKSHQVSSIIR